VGYLKDYLDGYESGGSTALITFAIATNSDGEFTQYTAAAKGADWANKVIDPVRAYVAQQHWSNIAIVGANDIEAGFAASLSQVSTWESYYLANTTGNLHYIGSANGCPKTSTVVTGKACDRGWTQQQYYNLASKLGRVRALPQIYVSGQASQWQNIDATGGKRLVFAGALSENGACPTGTNLSGCPRGGSYSPTTAWSALKTALARIGRAPLPVAVDLDVATVASS
jgi:hypothetical protein